MCFHNSACVTYHPLLRMAQPHREACQPETSAWFSLCGCAVGQRALVLASTHVLGQLMSPARSRQGTGTARRPEPSHPCCQVHGQLGLTVGALTPEPRPLLHVEAVLLEHLCASTWEV